MVSIFFGAAVVAGAVVVTLPSAGTVRVRGLTGVVTAATARDREQRDAGEEDDHPSGPAEVGAAEEGRQGSDTTRRMPRNPGTGRGSVEDGSSSARLRRVVSSRQPVSSIRSRFRGPGFSVSRSS